MESFWTEYNVERLKAAITSGLTGGQIRDVVFEGAITRNAVLGKIWRLGLSCGVKDEQQPAQEKPEQRNKLLFRRKKKSGTYYKNVKEAKQRNEPVSMLDVKRGQCRYIIGEPKDLLMCGAVTAENSSWCKHHFAICTIRGRNENPYRPRRNVVSGHCSVPVSTFGKATRKSDVRNAVATAE